MTNTETAQRKMIQRKLLVALVSTLLMRPVVPLLSTMFSRNKIHIRMISN